MSPPALGNPPVKGNGKVDPVDPPPPPPTPPEPLKLERAVLANLFGKLDPTLSRESFDAIFVRAGTTEAQALETLFKSLRKLLLNASDAINPADVREMNAALLAAIDGGARGRIVSLGSLTVDALGTLLGNDIGARYSLNNALPFALTGNAAIYEPHNRDNSLNKFDPNTGERLMSDAYLRDRASYFAVRLAAGPGTATVDVDGTQSWTFDDRRATGARLNASAVNAERAGNRMTFGNDEEAGEMIAGGNGNDRLYGGGGDDTMRGGAGDDYLEGGRGNDYLVGGRGDDTIEGGSGEDELDGGFGNDKLVGGAGADDLTGGKGDDRMEGGDGFDAYNIESGDGIDSILDSDGKGTVLLDGKALAGAMMYQGGVWKSDDGSMSFAFAGDPIEGGTLTVTTATNTIKIHQFRNGMLGMIFGDGKPESLATFAGGTLIPTDPLLPTEDIRYPADVYPNFGMTEQVDDRILRTIRGGTVQPGPVAAPNNFGGNNSGNNSGNESTWMPSTAAATSADPATQGATSAGPTSPSVDLTGRSFASSGGGLFQSPSQSLQFVTGAAVSRAVEADASSRFFAGPQATASTATDFAAVGAEGVQAYSTPMLSAADVQSALLDFHTGGDIDHAGDGAGGIDSSLIDQALSRHGGHGGLGGAESINARVSTELKPAEIGLGSVGIK
ncbi:MAG: hypothetical protein ING66_04280 [Rhodocyclaceae bacterium]|nr:hypothetical protein [Rhodocyclaceae bacterium]MCA3060673.1 hypothetical protein [Rhodocyclaceae bacterium]MCA3082114.1 hypothetical protein [Rhodocyclaceae bacterium]